MAVEPLQKVMQHSQFREFFCCCIKTCYYRYRRTRLRMSSNKQNFQILFQLNCLTFVANWLQLYKKEVINLSEVVTDLSTRYLHRYTLITVVN